MDRLIVQTEKQKEEKIAVETEVKSEEKSKEKETSQVLPSDVSDGKTEYLASLEDITVADYLKKEEEKKLKEFEKEKEDLIQKQYEKEETREEKPQKEKAVSQNIIEKPNYDLIQENKKIVRLKKRQKEKKSPNKKKLSLILSITLGIASIICVSNIIAIDQMSSDLAGLEYELYEVNLPKYLNDIANLDTTKKGMDFIETYPEEVYDAGEEGQKTNWFDKVCDFLSGLFGG